MREDAGRGTNAEGRFGMFQLLAHLGKHDLALRQLPAFMISFVLASFFYRFGSFALECLAFLATWFVIEGAALLLVGHLQRESTLASQTPRLRVPTRSNRSGS
jgi:hypothetical protein